MWIPGAELRDKRDLPRRRMVLSRERTRLRNRIHPTLAKYALNIQGRSDIFGKAGRELIEQRMEELPAHTRYATERVLEQLEVVESQISLFEQRMREVLSKTAELEVVMSLPGVGFILGVVIVLEVGDARRFPTASHLASYAGTTPRVHSNGGKTR